MTRRIFEDGTIIDNAPTRTANTQGLPKNLKVVFMIKKSSMIKILLRKIRQMKLGLTHQLARKENKRPNNYDQLKERLESLQEQLNKYQQK